MDLFASKTYQNLLSAYAGKLQTAAKYLTYQAKARDEGYEQIGDTFREISNHELEHAEIWLKWMFGGSLPTTLANLEEAAKSEQEAWRQMSGDFAGTAHEEGFEELSVLFKKVAQIEQQHETRFHRISSTMEKNEVRCKPYPIAWICTICGHITYAKCFPEICPVCENAQSFTELRCEYY